MSAVPRAGLVTFAAAAALWAGALAVLPTIDLWTRSSPSPMPSGLPTVPGGERAEIVPREADPTVAPPAATPWPAPTGSPEPSGPWTFDVAAASVPVTAPYTWELLAAGGIIYGRGVQERVERYGDPTRPFAYVRDLVRAADVAVATLEAPLSGDGNGWCQGCMTFVGDERYASAIAHAGFDALSLAGNHIGDAGTQGVLDSVRAVRGADMLAFGAGASEAEARRPGIVETHGVTVAFLGYCDVPPESYRATAERPGYAALVHTDGYRTVAADIAAARLVADVVVVMPHWGIEYEPRPRPWIVAAAHAMIDAGADVVLGDHSHWVQPVEIYKGRYIAYSLGNFVFDQMWSVETRQGSLHRLFFDGARLTSVRIVPTLLEDWHQPRPLRPDERAYAETMARIGKHAVPRP